MVDQELISRKLSLLEQYISELEKADDITWDRYISDVRARAFVERYLHLAIECIFDISNHIIAFHDWREPDNYRDIFTVLHENNIILRENLDALQQMASFRNILVHRYEKIDDDIVFGVFKKRLSDFQTFLSLIKDWLYNNKT